MTMDFSAILGNLGGLFEGIDFSDLLNSFMEAVKQLFNYIQPLLASLTGGESTGE